MLTWFKSTCKYYSLTVADFSRFSETYGMILISVHKNENHNIYIFYSFVGTMIFMFIIIMSKNYIISTLHYLLCLKIIIILISPPLQGMAKTTRFGPCIHVRNINWSVLFIPWIDSYTWEQTLCFLFFQHPIHQTQWWTDSSSELSCLYRLCPLRQREREVC